MIARLLVPSPVASAPGEPPAASGACGAVGHCGATLACTELRAFHEVRRRARFVEDRPVPMPLASAARTLKREAFLAGGFRDGALFAALPTNRSELPLKAELHLA